MLCSEAALMAACADCLCMLAQESIVKDVGEGEKRAKQLKGHLKEVLQACSGLQPKHNSRDRREPADTNGLQASRMSDGMLAGMSE